MKKRSLGLLLAASAALAPGLARAELGLALASGQKAAFGISDCNSNAERVVYYEGATLGNKLAVFLYSGSCPDEVPSDAQTLLAESTVDGSNSEGSFTVKAKEITDDKCPANEKIEMHVCAVERYQQANYYGGTTEWKVYQKADLLLSYDSKPPEAPVLKKAEGGESQIHVTWEASSDATEWLVCYKALGASAVQDDDPCAAYRFADGAACKDALDCRSHVCADGKCQAPSCTDGVLNGTESAIDCGGDCPACAGGLGCLRGNDCASGVCADDKCLEPSCTDNVRNGLETDLDCGGTGGCLACADGKSCATGSDCASDVCGGDPLTCQAATCTDGARNGTESDIDCGGSCPQDCAAERHCNGAADCQSGVCDQGTCRAPACDDGVRNGSEIDLDCGGSCPACGDGMGCTAPEDCSSGICEGERCLPASCGNQTMDGEETAVDCGGSSCLPCAAGLACELASDCLSGACNEKVCADAACNDGIENGAETDLDCGGGTCGGCLDGKRCVEGTDCANGSCVGGLCLPATCGNGARGGDETDVDCGGSCAACAGGKACLDDGDCLSGLCHERVCLPEHCGDAEKSGDETDLNCGGSCLPCLESKSCGKPADCVSGVCTGGKCIAPSCSDGVLNGTETGIDCGGDCAACGSPADGGTDGGEKADAGASDADAGTADGGTPAVNENPLSGCTKIVTFDGESTRTGSLKDLENGRDYEISMASRDEAGNYSKVSGTLQATPQLVYDFYERYRCAGGEEKGGFGCSSAGMALLPIAGLAALGLLRRRKGEGSEE